jgi:hypothetical protein
VKKIEGNRPDGQAKFLTQRLVPESWACHLLDAYLEQQPEAVRDTGLGIDPFIRKSLRALGYLQQLRLRE